MPDLWLPEGIEIEPAAPSEAEPILAHTYRSAKREEMRFDMHYALEAGIVLSGRQERQWGTWCRRFAPGDVWFCSVWEPHGWATVSAPCELVVLFIFPPMAAELRYPEAPDFDGLAPFVAPIGMQLAGPADSDRLLLDLAIRYEFITRWNER